MTRKPLNTLAGPSFLLGVFSLTWLVLVVFSRYPESGSSWLLLMAVIFVSALVAVLFGKWSLQQNQDRSKDGLAKAGVYLGWATIAVQTIGAAWFAFWALAFWNNSGF